jgi:photosystem II stability/assembly factor-like uncharacterized protein
MQKGYLLKIYLLFSIFPLFALAGGWYQPQDPMVSNTINKIITEDPESKLLFAVGDGGIILMSKDGGHGWMDISHPATFENLHDIAVYYGVPDTVLIVVGDNGTILRSIDFGFSWSLTDTLTGMNLYAVAYDFHLGTFIIGGDNSELHVSYDLGLSWLPATVDGALMQVREIIPTVYGVYLAAQRSDTTFVQTNGDTGTIYTTENTLPDIVLNNADEVFGTLYFAGYRVSSGEGIVHMRTDNDGSWDIPSIITPPGIGTAITDIKGMEADPFPLWIATSDGYIYQSDASANTFNMVYDNGIGEHIRSIAACLTDSPRPLAWAGGSSGLLLQYDFAVILLTPAPNQHMAIGQNQFEIRFSSIPQETSLYSGVHLHSSVQGSVPFTIAYQPDSTFVNIVIDPGAGTIPGEQWMVMLSNQIVEQNYTTNLQPFHYKVNVAPPISGSLGYDAPMPIHTIGGPTTNYVSGFFNDDDSFDLITFARDSLICFQGRGDGTFSQPVSIYINTNITVNTTIKRQLQKMDINRDGFLDLYLFDESGIRLIQNTSSSVFNFAAASYLPAPNIKDTRFYSANDDGLFDLVIVSDSLYIRTGISLSFFGSILSATDAMGWKQIEVGDIDLDGHDDFIAINTAGELIFRHNREMGGYDNELFFVGPFQDVKVADLDYDSDLDIIAQRDTLLTAYYYQPFWQFPPGPSLIQQSLRQIQDIMVTDLDGDFLPDVMMATDNQFVKIFKNSSPTRDVLAFTEETFSQITTDINVSRILFGDFDQEGTTDLVATDPESGDFQLMLKNSGMMISWQPVIDSVAVSNARVFLRWSQFPDSLGTFEYYRLYHDTLSYSFTNYTDIFNRSDTTFIDSTITPGRTRWYRVEASYNGGLVSDVSAERAVDVFNILEGSLSGILDDTTSFYFIPNQIRVDAGQSLSIFPNVTLVFDSAATFDVYGSLEILGTEDHMVGISGKEHNAHWQGINIAPGADTVRISWFHIEDAVRAFSIADRPVKINLGAVLKSETAFDLHGNTFLALKNIFISENDIGINAFDDVGVDLINLTLVDNKYEAVRTSNNAQVKGRNLIVWNNNFGDLMIKGTDILNNSSQRHILSYSTIDSLFGSFNLHEIQQLMPLFKPAGEDSMRYFPDEMSPTIDAGNPVDDYSMEPMPNGGRINQGIYGGTTFATPSLQPRLFVDNSTIHMTARLGESVSYPLKLYNRGTVDLYINSIDLFIPEFSLNALTFPMLIPPGDSSIVEINFYSIHQNVFTDTMYIRCTDPHIPGRGLQVILEGNSQEGPKFTASLDTSIYTYIPFSYQIQTDLATDQNYIFQDNTTIFDIDSLSGLIQFTPKRSAVGQHLVVITLRPTDFGGEVEQDTLIFDIRLNPVNAPSNFTATSGDQQITLRWENPDYRFYTKTLLNRRLRNINNEWGPAVVLADTILNRNSTTTYSARNLQADSEYQFTLSNYYAPASLADDAPVTSTSVQTTSRTLAPKISFDLSSRDIYVPPGDTLFSEFKIKNDGDGSLVCAFSYDNDALTNQWFSLDTTQKLIAPHDSILVEYRAHPVYTMEEKAHRLPLYLTTNQRDWQLQTTDIILHILFDRIAPRVVITDQPDNKHSYSAVRFDFTARDDTLLYGWPTGDPPEKLRMHYRFTDIQRSLIQADSGRVVEPLEFHPLADGRYRFELWIYDREGNGFARQAIAFDQQFDIKASARTLSANQWYLASMPRHQQMQLRTFFGDSSAHVYRWNNTEQKYLPYADSTLKGGEGLWILSLTNKELDVGSFKLDNEVDSTIVSLKKGWNQIGMPVAYPLDFALTKFITANNQLVTISEAIGSQLISPAIYWYHSAKQFAGYEWSEMDTTKVYPWRGYWVNTAQACRLIFVHKPALSKKVISVNAKVLTTTPFCDWRLNLQLQNEFHRDNGNIIGSSNVINTLPVFEPPPLEDYCSLSFYSKNGPVTRDLRQPFSSLKEVKEWNMAVATSNPSMEHTISWAQLSEEKDIYLYLVDQNREKIIDLSIDSLYLFTPNKKQYALKLYATQDAEFKPEIIPLTYRLAQNYPNPFNPSTTIKFGIPQSGAGKQTILTIYNLLGQKVITLFDRRMAAGYHTVEWNGTNRQGNKVATGLYFYRLHSDKHMLVRKMILLK